MEIGAMDALVGTIKTLVDGSISVNLNINPTKENIQIIGKLIELKANGNQTLTIGFVRSHE